MTMWQNREVTRRTAERRRREDEAPRLAATIPTLQGLRLDVLEHSSSISRPELSHARHVVVASAPALFVMPCHDTQCKDGGHDVTQQILAALRRSSARFEGEDVCRGRVGTADCSRIVKYVAVATYQSQPAAEHP